MTDSGSGIPFLTGGNLKDGKLSLDGASYITPEKHSKLTSGHLLEDDIVIAVRGSLGALGYVNTDNSGWNINSQLAILRTDKSELYGKFLIQYLLSWTGQNELLKRQTGSALKQLPIGAIKDVEVPITSIAEQGKIGEYFADLDNLITLHQRKCDETKQLKKFMLQKMFPKNGEKNPEIRFEGFTDDWEQRKLNEIADVRDGTHDSPKYVQEGHPFITSKNVSNGFINYDEVQYITDVDYEEINKRSKVDVHDILMGMIGTIGNLALIRQKPDFAIKNVALIKYTGDVDYQYLYQTLQVDCVTRQLFTGMDGGTQKFVSLKKIRELGIPFTEEQEQQKIGQYFEHLDTLISVSVAN